LVGWTVTDWRGKLNTGDAVLPSIQRQQRRRTISEVKEILNFKKLSL
jgi:hypothetical protein